VLEPTEPPDRLRFAEQGEPPRWSRSDDERNEVPQVRADARRVDHSDIDSNVNYPHARLEIQPGESSACPTMWPPRRRTGAGGAFTPATNANPNISHINSITNVVSRLLTNTLS